MVALVVLSLAFLLASCAQGPDSAATSSEPTTTETSSGQEDEGDDPVPTTVSSAAPTPSPTTKPEGELEDPGMQVTFEGATYECDSAGIARWVCGDIGSTIYCEGSGSPSECSEFWYPSELQGIRLVTFEGIKYACESYGLACVSYGGNGPPPALWNPEVWCDGLECTYYDPEVWFEVTFELSDYFCRDASTGFEHYDCYLSLGDTPPQATLDPDLYCSGSEYSLTCDERWYPSELQSVEIVTFNGVDYLCEPSYTGAYGDYDCGAYRGGDPDLVYTAELKCTDRGISFECDYDYYPSEFDNVSVTYIDGAEYICQDSWGGSECYRYYGGSPSSAVVGFPDLYCNPQGLCDEWDYP